jgi:hypothetical protein
MNLEKLLALFAAFDRTGVEYAVTGDLAGLMRGDVALSERLEVAIADDPANIQRARSGIAETWPEAQITECSPAILRVTLSNTPIYVEVIAQPVLNAEERLELRGVLVRVALATPPDDMRDIWSQPGFTLRERLAALHMLSRELVPAHHLSGVRKYRSIEKAEADRDRWEQERVDRLRAERLRK